MNANDDELFAYARLTAGQLAPKWPNVSADDITQEICAYVLGTPRVLEEWDNWCEGDYASEEDERYASNRIRTICRRAGERFARRELAAIVGYAPPDEAFYSLGHLRVLVENFFLEGLSERPPIGRAESVVKTVSDPASGGNYLISLLDVERGIGLLPAKYRNRLRFRFHDLGEYSDPEIVKLVANLATAPGKRRRIEKHLGTTENTVRGRTRIALQKLQEKLGGPSPYRKTDVEEGVAAPVAA